MTKRIVLFIGISLFILFVTLYVLVMTRPGIQASYRLLRLALPGTLSIEKLSGKNLSALHLESLKYVDNTQSLEIGTLDINWSPLSLLRHRLYIDTLAINSLTLTDKATDNKPFEMPKFNDVMLKNINIKQSTWIDLSRERHYIELIHITTQSTDKNQRKIELTAQSDHVNINGSGLITEQFQFELNLNLAIKRFKQTLTGNAHLSGNWQKLSVDAKLNEPFSSSLHGTIDLTTHSPQVDLHAQWKLLAWPLTDKPLIELHDGHMTFKGPLEQYMVKLETDINTPYSPQTHINGSGRGSLNEINIEPFVMGSLSGEIRGTAHITNKPFKWDLSLKGNDLNPGQYWQGYDGQVNFEITGHGDEQNLDKHQLKLVNLSGRLKQKPIFGQGEIEFSRHHWLIKKLNVKLIDNELNINGGYTDHWDLRWAIALPNLQTFNPQLSGSISSKGRIKATDVSSKTTINELKYHHYHISKMEVTSLGDFAKHQIHLQNSTDETDIRLTGHYKDSNWNARLETFNWKNGSYHWKLSDPVRIFYSPSQFKLSAACWSVNHKKICSNIDYKNNTDWMLTINTKQLPTAAIIPENDRMQVDSQLELALSATRTKDKLALNLQSKLNGGAIRFNLDDEQHREEINELSLNAGINPRGLHLKLNGELGAKRTISGELRLPSYQGTSLPDPDQLLQGLVQVNFPDLTLFAHISPAIRDIKGTSQLKLNLAGNVSSPKINGEFSLRNAQAALPLLGIQLSQVNFNLSGRGSNELDYHGQARSGKGNIVFHGKASFKNKSMNSETTLEGANFTLMNTDEYLLVIDPKLQITSVGRKLNCRGSIHLPKAKIAPKDFSHTVEMPSEVIYVDQQTTESLPFKLTSDIELSLGKQVELDVLGIRGRLGGQLKVDDTPLKPTSASGEIEIFDGKYEAYGRNLIIKRGVLSFTGGRIDNPGLNVIAQRDISRVDENTVSANQPGQQFFSNRISSSFAQSANQITVGVNIGGTLEKPDIKLFSSPVSMPDSEILSYLLLNRSTSQLLNTDGSSADHRTLLNAIPALGLSSDAASHITHELQHTLGLDQIEITGTDDPLSNNLTDTSISIGKAISQRLYVSYSYGLLNAKNALRIRYLLSSRWTIQTEAVNDAESSAKSIDFIYSIAK